MNKIIDGKAIAQSYKDEIRTKVSGMDEKLKLAVIQVGNNPASDVYVRNKGRVCDEMGILFDLKKYDSISEDDLLGVIDGLNNDDSVTSILVQLPLPSEIDEERVIESINPLKDVDGLTSANIGKLFAHEDGIAPCTALGVMKLLEHENISLEGKKAVIVGRSKLVGTPLIALLLNKNATVSVCHSKTNDLASITSDADILVVAIGKKEFITKDMVKDGAVVIDVGINRGADKLYGDVNFPDVYDKVSRITPVPKGVGPMTVAMLMNNVLECDRIQKKEKARRRK